MSWWFILYVLEHLVNFIIPLSQSTSGLCFTNQSYFKNISMPFRSVTAASICSLCLLISTSNGVNLVTSPFFVLSTLKTSNDLSIGSVLILSSLTNCSLIPVWVHPESTSACSCDSFLFFVLMLVCMFNSLSLLFLWFGIIYQFWDLLCTKVCCIVPTPNLQQNPLIFHLLSLLLDFSYSSLVVWICNPWLGVLLCHICNTSSILFLSWTFCILWQCVCIHCN